MMKGNESDIGKIDLHMYMLIEKTQILMFYMYRTLFLKELFISLQPDVQLKWFESKRSILNGQVEKSQLNKFNM